MNVILEAIKFNHDPTSATNDAFNIRRNEIEPVIVPEWRQGITINPEDAPAAYAKDTIGRNAITIKAKFTCSDRTVSNISVQVVNGGGDINVLGEVPSTPVTLVNGESDFVSLTLNSPNFSQAGVSVSDIVWRWQYSVSAGVWTDFAITTHRIYTVLAMPTAPWQPDSADSYNTQQPWTEVLDFACRWAASTTSTAEAATLVTRRVNGLGPGLVKYDDNQSGSSSFTIESPPSFDCGDFLLLLRGQPNQHGSAVNCDDCAAFVANFSNILGCSLAEARMDHNIPLNPHLRIGTSALQTDEFGFHRVAWSGACQENDLVFDACVQLDSDDCPASPPHPLFVPTNILFGTVDDHFYRFRLASDPSRCNPVQEPPLHRRIGFPKLTTPDVCRLLATLAKSPGKRNTANNVFNQLLWEFADDLTVFNVWRLQDLYFIDDPKSIVSAYSFWQSKVESDVALRVEMHLVRSVLKAESKLKQLLSSFQLRHIKKQEDPEFGDVVHTVPGDFVIVFSRGDFVIRLRNVGKRFVSGKRFAQAIDNFLLIKNHEGSDKRIPK